MTEFIQKRHSKMSFINVINVIAYLFEILVVSYEWLLPSIHLDSWYFEAPVMKNLVKIWSIKFLSNLFFSDFFIQQIF